MQKMASLLAVLGLCSLAQANIVADAVTVPVPASADEVILIPIKDAYVHSINPDTNYGHSQDLWMGKGTYWDLGYARSLVQFDLSSLPGDPNLITSAVFSAYQYATAPAAGGRAVDVKRITSTWDEDTVTWNNPPNYDDTTVWASAAVGDCFLYDWVNWDVTALVKNQVSGGSTNLGWLLKMYWEIPAGASRLGYFRSTDYTADPILRPKLVVDYIPEPASLLLLALGGLFQRRR
jgi:hypothetical protein